MSDNKRRNPNLELLRILAMLMIVSLHYLDKGGVLPDPAGTVAGHGLIAWLIEAFCVPAVDTYVLISAYFLIDREYEPGRALRLWGRVIFYSVGIGLLLSILSGSPDRYTWLRFLMPVTQEHYWFITAYVIMVLIAPLMNKGLRSLAERTYRWGLAALLGVYSLSVSVLPVVLPIDKKGYDALWFICLYMVGGYVRLHLKPFRLAFAGYIAMCLGIFGSLFVLNRFYLSTGSLGDFVRRQYQYNSIPCLLASVCLLLAFIRLDMSAVGERVKGMILKAASASLGVYLIHEHELIRYRWPVIFGVKEGFEGPLFLVHWFITIIVVYLIGTVIELARQGMVLWIKKYWWWRRTRMMS